MDNQILLTYTITDSMCYHDAKITGNQIILPAASGGIDLTEPFAKGHRYMKIPLKAEVSHSVAMELQFYAKESETDEADFILRFGLLPNVLADFVFDAEWLNGNLLFPEPELGLLKFVCHGNGRIARDAVDRVVLVNYPCFQDIPMVFGTISCHDAYPEVHFQPEQKYIDPFGQWKLRDWKGKTKSLADLTGALEAQRTLSETCTGWTAYGADKATYLTKGSGFFSSIKQNNRWHLVDPDGYAFFSLGVDCVRISSDCRIDGMEDLLDELPDKQEFGEFYGSHAPSDRKLDRRKLQSVSYEGINLKRAFGADWRTKWMEMVPNAMRYYGLNTLGCWSDMDLCDTAKTPYVWTLPHFPDTSQFIFRDFPDVFSDEYQKNASESAAALQERKDDPYMIGYFLRNEPAWAFVQNLIIADEVLINPAPSACKDALLCFLQQRYTSIAELNAAWGTAFPDFDALKQLKQKASAFSAQAEQDMRSFSRDMIRRYVSVPSEACRKVDPNHMILGMRWAWISDPDTVSGWECFDVFSLNCYALNPYNALENVRLSGVDLPVMIGEFHFGALDGALPATGLEAVQTQSDRGLAFRYYCEHAAAHPNAVGCHYFQFFDQFALGRFDGENYNIGLFDLCSRPYEDMLKWVKLCAERIYDVRKGAIPPTEECPERIPMIAY